MELNPLDSTDPNNSASKLLLKTPNASLTADDQWHHIAWTRSGTANRLFIDGVKLAEDLNAFKATFDDLGDHMIAHCSSVSSLYSSSTGVHGYMSHFRLTVDQALYTANFTVPSVISMAPSGFRTFFSYTDDSFVKDVDGNCI